MTKRIVLPAVLALSFVVAACAPTTVTPVVGESVEVLATAEGDYELGVSIDALTSNLYLTERLRQEFLEGTPESACQVIKDSRLEFVGRYWHADDIQTVLFDISPEQLQQSLDAFRAAALASDGFTAHLMGLCPDMTWNFLDG